MASLYALGLSLLRYSRAEAWLRLRRSCWRGLPAPFKLGVWASWRLPGAVRRSLRTLSGLPWGLVE
eukprot:8252364-Pyramimonas_sp.AAC.1